MSIFTAFNPAITFICAVGILCAVLMVTARLVPST